jgi:serine/threonine-protein kinase
MNRLSDPQGPPSERGIESAAGGEVDPYLGKVMGRYRVGSPLTTAQKFRVYRAHDLNTNVEARIKVLIRAGDADQEQIEQALKDAQVAGTLGHPNIAPTLQTGLTQDGSPFFVNEALNGKLLEEVILSSGQMSVGRAAGIIAQVASALQAVHQVGILHGFLNPQNVAVQQSGDTDRVRILDFGVSAFNGFGVGPGRFLGPPNCMAPEQMADGGDVDVRADVYALGALFYTMLTGEMPFAKLMPREVAKAITDEEPAKLRTFRPELRVSLLQVVNRAMRKLRDDRFQTVRELLDALGRLEAVPAASAVASGVSPVAAPTLVQTAASPFAPTMVAAQEAPAAPAPPVAPIASVASVAPSIESTSPAALRPAPLPSFPEEPTGNTVPAPSLSEAPRAEHALAERTAAAVPATPRALPVETPEKKRNKAIFAIPVALALAGLGFLMMRSAGSGGDAHTQSSPPTAATTTTLASPTGNTPANVPTGQVATPPTKDTARPDDKLAAKGDPARAQLTPAPVAPRAPRPVTSPVPRPVTAPVPEKPTPVAATPAPATPATPTPTVKKPRTSAELEPEEYFEEYPSNAKKK